MTCQSPGAPCLLDKQPHLILSASLSTGRTPLSLLFNLFKRYSGFCPDHKHDKQSYRHSRQGN